MTDWMVHKEITTQVFIYVVDEVQNIGEIKDFRAWIDFMYILKMRNCYIHFVK